MKSYTVMFGKKEVKFYEHGISIREGKELSFFLYSELEKIEKYRKEYFGER